MKSEQGGIGENQPKQEVPKSSAKPVGDSGAAKAFLGKGSKVVGQLNFDGSAEIEGELEGEIVSQAQLVIGRSAKVKAKIHGQEVIVLGTVEGDIHAAKRLSLKQPARITGNISAPVLSVEEGVMFQGNCRMDGTEQKK